MEKLACIIPRQGIAIDVTFFKNLARIYLISWNLLCVRIINDVRPFINSFWCNSGKFQSKFINDLPAFIFTYLIHNWTDSLITARKRSLRRLCFYRRLSVHRGGCAWLLGGGCVVAQGACMVAPRGACVVARGGHTWLLQGGVCGCSGGACVVALGGHAWLLRGGVRGFFDEIWSMSGRYVSYWNAFLFTWHFMEYYFH